MKENLYVVVKGNVPQEKVRAIVAEISKCYEKLEIEPEFCEVLIFRSRYDVDRFIEEENELVYSRLGVRISGIAPDSSATHFAWRGWPTIAICVSDMESKPWNVALAELRRAVAHSILHGSPKYYFIPLPRKLFDLRSRGIIRPDILDVTFYIFTTAIKSFEVTRFLVNKGFIECQKKLYQYHLKVKPEEKRVWEKAVNETNILAPLLMNVFKVLSGVTPLIEVTRDTVLTALYEENLNLIPEHIKKHLQKMLNKLHELGEDTLENIFNMADELYELLTYFLP